MQKRLKSFSTGKECYILRSCLLTNVIIIYDEQAHKFINFSRTNIERITPQIYVKSRIQQSH